MSVYYQKKSQALRRKIKKLDNYTGSMMDKDFSFAKFRPIFLSLVNRDAPIIPMGDWKILKD